MIFQHGLRTLGMALLLCSSALAGLPESYVVVLNDTNEEVGVRIGEKGSEYVSLEQRLEPSYGLIERSRTERNGQVVVVMGGNSKGVFSNVRKGDYYLKVRMGDPNFGPCRYFKSAEFQVGDAQEVELTLAGRRNNLFGAKFEPISKGEYEEEPAH